MGLVSKRAGREEMSELFAQVREGSMEAFDRFYESAAPFVTGIAGKMLGGDRMEAEDVCHDVLLEVISRPERYSPERGSVEAWLAVLTKSRCADRLRKRSRVVLERQTAAFEQTFAFAGEYALPEQQVVAKLQGEALRQAMSELDGAQRRALSEVYYGHRSRRELAEAWQVPVGTVKSRVRYGLQHLNKAMKRLGWTNDAKGGG
ncbi:RNA polymerase sigma factor [Paenibacillaceae bacterium WGS1546]|uniref:RNA polymerase sigma factor n=1 Tax=Cohnella sp. WGS1546 TaxID=3366810 RepID=UPI00372D5933